MECRNSSLCIFDEEPIQTDIIKSSVVDYFPISNITSGGPIEFNIPGNAEDYIDVNDINLKIRFKVTLQDGSDIEDAHKVGPNNLLLTTIFQDVMLTIGETQVEGGQQSYPYAAYLNTVMQFHPSAQKSHMITMGWKKDEKGKFDDATNSGFTARQEWIEDSEVCELYGPLHLDFFRQSRYLISQTPLRIKLIPSKPEFVLNSYATPLPSFKIQFESATLHVRRMLLNPSVINGHAKGLTMRNARYPINRTEIVSFTIPTGQKSYVKDRLFPHQQPKLLMIAMVDNDAYNGSLSKNPFHFKHYNLDKLALYRDGECIPGRPFTPDFDKKLYAREYVHTMSTFQYFNTDDTNGLTYDEFGNGYTMFAFDLTASNDITASYRDANTTTNLRLELNFAKDLPNTINVLLYAVFNSHIEITKLRDVIPAYKF